MENEDMEETAPTQSSFLGTAGIASRSDPYHGTRPMEINSVGHGTTTMGETGISFGVDVSHMAPKPDGALAGVNDDEDGRNMVSPSARESEKAQTVTASVSDTTSQQPLSMRPVLDEAISWDRIAGVNKSESKRKWWHMP
ncbi:hypothetical protein RhiLY_12440 [Ceratobasidium sp. AG-Ba]|nr:hypothetical protein RhiLY_12440 [Ceratobasidium sp. AG-Ba]